LHLCNTIVIMSEFNVEDLLRSALRPDTLKDKFENRLAELGISATNAASILEIDQRAMMNIINGSKKIADYTNIMKIASFLQISRAEIMEMYVSSMEKNFPEHSLLSPEKVTFIKNNFDLASLKKAKFIDSIIDFAEIDKKLTTALGLKSILDYQKPQNNVAYSEGKELSTEDNNRSQWIAFARDTFEEISNPNDYNRKAIIEYFPQIRWNCTNIELGLPNVIRELYKMGVTVIYQDPLPSLHVRGATFSVYDKPCIVITNYRGFYPTLWFALLHELFHVLFDWEEIKVNLYHLSEEVDTLTKKEKEDEANKFAREYLFSIEKTKSVKRYLNNDEDFVIKFTKDNHVHPSFAYVFNAFDLGKTHRWAWALANTHNPKNEMSTLLKGFSNPWEQLKPVREHAKYLTTKYYK